MRWLYVGAGFACLALGAVGLVVPLLPTTPFLLLAAACFARGSPRFYAWLLANPTFGPAIREWREHRSIPYRTKMVAIALMALTLTLSIALFVERAWLQWTLAALGLGLAGWLYSVPSRDRPARGS